MTNQIPLGKQLKYALQEKEALQEELKDRTIDYFSGVIIEEQLDEVGADLDRASEEVSELEFLLDEATKLEILEQNHIDLIAIKFHEEVEAAKEDQLRQQEWMNAIDQAYEEGYFIGC
jgi:hypothetical protein